MTSERVNKTEQVYDRRSEVSAFSRPARIKAVKEHLGFYPQNNDELSSIIAIVGRSPRERPVLSYLDEVYKHQLDAGADAPATLRLVVHSFEDYAGNAIDERSYAEGLLATIRASDPNLLTGFTRLFPTENWENDHTLRATFTALARYIQTGQFAEAGEIDSLVKENLIDETTGYDRVGRIIGTLGLLRVSSLKRTAAAMRDSQEKRFAFWADKLEASKSHLFVRDIADAALRNLHTFSN